MLLQVVSNVFMVCGVSIEMTTVIQFLFVKNVMVVQNKGEIIYKFRYTERRKFADYLVVYIIDIY